MTNSSNPEPSNASLKLVIMRVDHGFTYGILSALGSPFVSEDTKTTTVTLLTWLTYNMVRIQYFALAILVVFFAQDVNAVTDEQFEVSFKCTAAFLLK